MNERRYRVKDGEFAGWDSWHSAGFERHSGPYFEQLRPDGTRRLAFRAQARHMNPHGAMHGGCLMTFADAALFTIAHDALGGGRGVTLHLAGDFLAPVAEGQLVEAHGEVTRGGGKTIFARGMATADGVPALSFTGIVRRVSPPA